MAATMQGALTRSFVRTPVRLALDRKNGTGLSPCPSHQIPLISPSLEYEGLHGMVLLLSSALNLYWLCIKTVIALKNASSGRMVQPDTRPTKENPTNKRRSTGWRQGQ